MQLNQNKSPVLIVGYARNKIKETVQQSPDLLHITPSSIL